MNDKEEFPFYVLLPLVAIGVYVVSSLLAVGFIDNSGWVETSGTRNFVMSRIWMQIFVAFACILSLFLIKPFSLYKDYRCLGTSWWNASVAFEAFVFIAIASNLLEGFLDVQMDDNLTNLFQRSLEEPIGIVLICVLVPVCEEVVFRGGIMKPLMRNNINVWIPIFISAGVFALMHGNAAQIIYAFLLGLVFAIIYALTKSLVITTICHIANNTFTAILWNLDRDYITADFDDVVGNDVVFGVMIATFIIGGWLLWFFWQRTRQEQQQETIENQMITPETNQPSTL